jgi:hypothetical protein
MANSNNRLKAYVRYDGTGRVIAGSLILQRSKPKVGNWQEIDANECCNPTTTTTTTTEAPVTTTTTSSSTSTSTSTTSTSTSTSTSTTSTTTTPTPGACFCYTISNETAGTLLYTYTDCSSSEYFRTPINADTLVIVCSSTAVTGDAGLVITGGSFSCSTAEDCAG